MLPRIEYNPNAKKKVLAVKRGFWGKKDLAYMANKPRSRNDPPIEEEGKRHQLPRGVVERDKEYASVCAMLRMATAWSVLLGCSKVQNAASTI